MLPMRLLVKNIRPQVTLPYQWLRSITINTLRLSSKSSSSDSSDSDSESSKQSQDKGKLHNTINRSNNMIHNDDDKNDNEIVNSILNRKPSRIKDIHVNIRNSEEKYNRKLANMAETITRADKNSKEKFVTFIMENLAQSKQYNRRLKDIKMTSHEINKPTNFESMDKTDIFKKMKSEAQKIKTTYNLETEHDESKRFQTDINQQIVIENEAKKIKDRYGLKEHNLRTKDTTVFDIQRLENIMCKFKTLFTQTFVPSENVPECKTWNACEQNEFETLKTTYPETGFQEMMQWTEEGKLWKFPIDNEQGMEEEQSVHFSEHIFLDRHLEGWCPTKGPIRHYMELVCVGLSKNPYLTVQEKYEHIMWYKDFFNDKKDLLHKLGLVDSAISDTKKQIETQ